MYVMRTAGILVSLATTPPLLILLQRAGRGRFIIAFSFRGKGSGYFEKFYLSSGAG